MAEELPIKYVKDKGERFLPITSTKAVVNKDGVSVEDLLLQDGNVYEFAKDEMDKTLNLIEGVATTNEYIQAHNGNIASSSSSLLTTYVPIDASKDVLMLNSVGTWDGAERSICFYDVNKTLIGGFVYTGTTYSFPIPSGATYFRIAYLKTLTNVSVSYGGKILHQVDITPVTAWENASPNSSLGSSTMSLSVSMNDYPKGKLYYKVYINSFADQCIEFVYTQGKTIMLNSLNSYNYTIRRKFTLTNDRTISFDNGDMNGAGDGGALVPTKLELFK